MGGGVFDEAGSQFIRPGYLAYHSAYWNKKDKRMEKPPVGFIEMYQSLAKVVKKSSTRIMPGKRAYWLGPGAEKAVQDSAKLVGYEKSSADELRP
jgi:hypothetical protein